MARIDALTEVDPLTVPLPHGTEVTTRVDRAVDGRVVPQGAMGRVVASGPEGFDVALVGVGTVRYHRSELTPRKVGQVRYARRREAAWEALSRCVVLDAVVGSRTWGLSDATSDTDRRGAFVLPYGWTTGLSEPPTDLVSADGSATYWEAGKTVRQGLRADPNTLEMLYAAAEQGEAVRDPMGRFLVEVRDAFVSVEIHGSFGRYALSQLDRLEQGARLADHRAKVLGWLRNEPTLTLDATAARLADAVKIPAPTAADAHARAKDYIKQLYRSLYDQGLIPDREWVALVRLASSDASLALDTPRELRPKNAYNLLRLIDLSTRWLRGEDRGLRVPDAIRPTLLSIKRGEVEMSEVLAMARAMTPALEAARRESPLPKRPDLSRAEAALRRVREDCARRWAEGTPGPWGRDAPTAPDARWDDEGGEG